MRYPIRQLKIPTLPEVAEMCHLADPSMNAWICCQKDSGLRMFDMLSLSFADIKDQLNKQKVPIHIQVQHKMLSLLTNTFFGPNAIDALKKYEPKEEGKPLFDIRPKIIQNRLKKLGLTSFSLRQFFYLRMAQAGVSREVLEHWLGHRTTPFFSMSLSSMAQIYMESYKYLDIKSSRAVKCL